MAGISSNAAGKLENKKNKFQGQELDDDLGLNYYGFKWRNHDPQIGRFIEIDPLSDKYVHNSTYAFSENKVTSHVELEGLEAVEVKHYMYLKNGKAQTLYYSKSEVNNPNGLGSGTLLHTVLVNDDKGKQNVTSTDIYKKSFGDKVEDFFSDKGGIQFQIFGSGDGSESPGSKASDKKATISIDLETFGPVFDVLVKGGIRPSMSGPEMSDFAELAKGLFDKVSDAIKPSKDDSNNSGSTTKKPLRVKYHYDGTPANNETGNGSGERTSADPTKPDTMMYTNKQKK